MKKLALAALLLAGLLFAVPTDGPDSANCACECGCECEDACACSDGGECTCAEGCADACECKEATAEMSRCGGMNTGSCGGCGR
ncbi:MAG: hypothetical protein R6V62_07835 [Candidatus Fermentibacteraceae bacterium]